ncbi:hypothetical protein KUCAC02_035174, partial [Chaenocephalus aceratus]
MTVFLCVRQLSPELLTGFGDKADRGVFSVSAATSGDSHLKLLSDVAQTVKGQGTIAWVNCGDGTFHTEYNRPATFK